MASITYGNSSHGRDLQSLISTATFTFTDAHIQESTLNVIVLVLAIVFVHDLVIVLAFVRLAAFLA